MHSELETRNWVDRHHSRNLVEMVLVNANMLLLCTFGLREGLFSQIHVWKLYMYVGMSPRIDIPINPDHPSPPPNNIMDPKEKKRKEKMDHEPIAAPRDIEPSLTPRKPR